MTYAQIKQLNSKLYFTLSDLTRILGIKRVSARVLCSRYVKSGIFVRLKNNFYLTAQKRDSLSPDDYLKIANFLQVPSYVSFTSSLREYEFTTQVQRGFCESASVRRSVRFSIAGAQFNYYKLKKKLYFGFIKKNGYFIALPEKAFLDALYLYLMGKYKIDLNALDLGKLDKGKLKSFLKVFPPRVKEMAARLCKI
ncbi:MAG: hypothetical protein WC628_09670 [Candidatus Omnitrophota bacterium]